MQVVQLARPGRKRKSGRRTASGHLAREHVNYAALAAEQPHRRGLPAELRTHPDAVTELGRLALLGLITQPQKLAGEEYSRRVGAYRATIAPPSQLGARGRSFECNPIGCGLEPEKCTCERRKGELRVLLDVLTDCGGRVKIATEMVCIEDQRATEAVLGYVTLGLAALANRLGLTKHGKSANVRN